MDFAKKGHPLVKVLASLALVSILSVVVEAAQSFSGGYLVPLPGGESIVVWRDQAAMVEGLTLVANNVHRSNPAVLLPLIACVVDRGTRVVVTSAPKGYVTVVVVDGKNSGCRGLILQRNLVQDLPR